MPGLDVTPKPASGRQLIDGYGAGSFKIAGQRYIGSVLVLPTRTLTWPVTALEQITRESLTPLLDATGGPMAALRILVLGCGRRFAPAPGRLGPELMEAGVALEWMDTGAACRTFNVLVLEDRDVAAALLAVE